MAQQQEIKSPPAALRLFTCRGNTSRGEARWDSLGKIFLTAGGEWGAGGKALPFVLPLRHPRALFLIGPLELVPLSAFPQVGSLLKVWEVGNDHSPAAR